MKTSIKKYSKILYEALESSKVGEDIVIKNFVQLLKTNKDLKNSNQIIKGFTEIFNEKNGIVEVKVISKTVLEDKEKESIKDFFIKEKGFKQVEIESKLDPEMIGGLIIKTKDEMIDGSIDKRISDLRKHLQA